MEKIYILFAIATIIGLFMNSFGAYKEVLSTSGSIGVILFAQSSGGGSQEGGSQDDQKPEPKPEPEPEPQPTDTSC
jgi:hypothetical protein